MPVEQLSAQPPTQSVPQRGTLFPGFSLPSAVEFMHVLQSKCGGQATPEQLASHAGYKGTNNGAYLSRVAAAKTFGLIMRNGPVFILTQLGHRILSPVYPQDKLAALVEAFMSADLFRRIYEDFKGKELPPEFGMKNALRNVYGVRPERLNDCYRVLMESAEAAGFFLTRSGARTHLIMPLVQPVPGAPTPSPAPAPETSFGGGSGGGANPPPPPPPPAPATAATGASQSSIDAYLAILTRALDKSLESGQADEKIMDRIERALGLRNASQ